MSRSTRSSALFLVMLGVIALLATWIGSTGIVRAQVGTAGVMLTPTPPNATFTRTPLPTSAATCTIGPTGTPTSPPLPCSLQTGTLLSANFDNGYLSPLISSVALTDTGGWDVVYEGTRCVGHDFAAFAPDPPSVSDQRLTTSASVAIPAGAVSAYLHFDHSYEFQPADGGYRDGGVLEMSTDGGQSWFDAGSRITSGAYNGTITRTGETCNGITPPFSNGQSAWVGTRATHNVFVNLSEFAGQSIMFRFRLGTDCSVGGQDWRIDDLSVLYQYRYACTPTALPTSTATATSTSTPGTPVATPTACALTFTDVPADNTFYPFVRCLACQGIVSGYECGGPGEPCNANDDPYFRPNNYVTRGQLAKIASESAGFDEEVPPSQWTFADVPYGSTFWVWVERLANREVMGGYPCGQDPNEPCDSENRPYFRPNNGATRGQLAKIIVNAAGFVNGPPPDHCTFADTCGGTFGLVIELLVYNRPGSISGYPCGSVPYEPCDSENRPYFRPNNPLTRGQTSKVASSVFFPGCSPPAR